MHTEVMHTEAIHTVVMLKATDMPNGIVPMSAARKVIGRASERHIGEATDKSIAFEWEPTPG